MTLHTEASSRGPVFALSCVSLLLPALKSAMVSALQVTQFEGRAGYLFSDKVLMSADNTSTIAKVRPSSVAFL